VKTPHAYTARMCAATRWAESQRRDSLFTDALAKRLAGTEGMRNPMGDWIMVPRTRYGDDLLRDAYMRNHCRQLVLLGAGMDARAYRMQGMPELRVFEVDQQTTFDVKEPLLRGEQLLVKSRRTVGTDFRERNRWVKDLLTQQIDGSDYSVSNTLTTFDSSVPTVWLLEGLLMYLSMDDTIALMQNIKYLSAPGSVVFHDAVSERYIDQGIVVGGAPFIGGSDDYAGLWHTHAGFSTTPDYFVRDFDSIEVNRARRKLILHTETYRGLGAEATPARCHGRQLCLFVSVEKHGNRTGQYF